MTTVAFLDLGTREMHMPSGRHGVAMCGERMPDAGWMAGPIDALLERADYWCPTCFQDTDPL